jgi:TM2 domain-containing membrane protein YozV
MLGVSPKNRLVAGLLGILIGGLGIHNFYLGFTTKGVIQLVLTITVFFWWAAAIWGLVEGIIILTSKDPKDVNGLSLVFS